MGILGDIIGDLILPAAGHVVRSVGPTVGEIAKASAGYTAAAIKSGKEVGEAIKDTGKMLVDAATSRD